MKKHWKKIALALMVPFAALNMVAIRNPDNRSATSPQHTDARLRTRFYQQSPEDILKIVEQSVPRIKTYGQHWRIREIKHLNQIITIWCEVPVLIFTDDLQIEIKANNASTQVNIESKSRVGKSDLGENQRHLIKLLDILDEKLHLQA